ncbi:hypothetical protein G6F61_013955 [Rhizopus arrhizus]|nr:hypothetical protein G6F68_015482 [Rhizopus microsporus]KAG1363029.1 hypothetical protein G6F61_013955 [Rhizopus arrhizus]
MPVELRPDQERMRGEQIQISTAGDTTTAPLSDTALHLRERGAIRWGSGPQRADPRLVQCTNGFQLGPGHGRVTGQCRRDGVADGPLSPPIQEHPRGRTFKPIRPLRTR